MMRVGLLLVAAAVPLLGAGTACEKLVEMTIPLVRIESAAVVDGHCEVKAVARVVEDSEIHFELWMPGAAAWNGKFQGVGNGGYSGAISYAAMRKALAAGYATASHDTGHSGDSMRFGQGHPEKVKDYAYRAVHVMTEYSKLLVRVHMGRFATQSYFVGCSAGGHQAISEAERYPEDYDGIVAGAPANNRLRQTFGFLWSWMAVHPEGQLILPPEKLAVITRAVVKACDAVDGLKDGLIDDPRKCNFDPGALLCEGPECLSAGQVEAVRKIYKGVHDERGVRIFAGWPKGSEDFGDGSWKPYILNPKEPMRVELFRYFLFHDPNWDYRTVQWGKDLAYAEERLPYMQAVSRDLGAFARRGGKLLLYAGWADPVVVPEDTVRYYTRLQGAAAFARLFMAPGMGHCGGGPGPNVFDAVGTLDEWVRTGKAPEKMLATHKSGRSRPLCPYPQVARYTGKGSVEEAGSFVCVAGQ